MIFIFLCICGFCIAFFFFFVVSFFFVLDCVFFFYWLRTWFAFISFGLHVVSFTFGSVGNGPSRSTSQHFSG